MTAEIKQFTGNTLCDLKADDVLEAAKEKLEEALILGWAEDGDFYLASTTSQIGNMLLLLELAKSALLKAL